MKKIFTKSLRMFGFVYFLLNVVLMVVMGIFAIQAMIKTDMSPGFVVFILPLMGMFSGYWMQTGRYGWWRISIIAVSLSLSVAIAFIAIFVAPEMEKHNQNKVKNTNEAVLLPPEVEKMFSALYADDLETVRQQLKMPPRGRPPLKQRIIIERKRGYSVGYQSRVGVVRLGKIT